MNAARSAPAGRFAPSPPLPPAYGLAAAIALGIGLFGGFAAGLYGMGAFAFGWPADGFVALVQAHGQAQTLGLAGLLILAVGSLLLPGFWKARLNRPDRIRTAAVLVGVGLAAQLLGQPLTPSMPRALLLALAAALPPLGFGWAGAELARLRLKQPERPEPWEALLLLGAGSLALALLLRAALLLDLALGGARAGGGPPHAALLVLELDGFLMAATAGVQLRLLPALARTGAVPDWAPWLGLALLAPAVATRALAPALGSHPIGVLGDWLLASATLALFLATGLARPGVPPTVRAPATRLPGRTRWVLRAAWVGLLAGVLGHPTGLLSDDAARHAFTSAYLVPLALVVGMRLLPRVSAYPIRFPRLAGGLVWMGLLGGALRAFAVLAPSRAGFQLAWCGGVLLTLAVLAFALLAWSPWGVPRGLPREPEVSRR